MPTSVAGITVKLDMLGSFTNIGIARNKRDRALRRGVVSGLAASVGDEHELLKLAWEAVFPVVGLFHNTITNLPLQDIRVRQFGRTKVWFDLIYFRDYRSLSTPSNNLAFAYSRSVTRMLTIYRHASEVDGTPAFSEATGLPSGPMYGNSPKRLEDELTFPWHYQWSRNASRIIIPTVLAFHPYSVSGVADLMGKVNSDTVFIGQVSFAPNTLKFEYADVNIRRPGFGVTGISPGDIGPTFPILLYEVQYIFTAIPEGHWIQQPIFGTDPDKGPPLDEWTAIDVLEWKALPFAGAFPLGT